MEQKTLDGRNVIMDVMDLINLLESFDPKLPVFTQISDDCDSCYRRVSAERVLVQGVLDAETEKESPALIIGAFDFP